MTAALSSFTGLWTARLRPSAVVEVRQIVRKLPVEWRPFFVMKKARLSVRLSNTATGNFFVPLSAIAAS